MTMCWKMSPTKRKLMRWPRDPQPGPGALCRGLSRTGRSKIAPSPSSIRRRRGERASACARHGDRCPLTRARFRRRPAAMGGACGATPRLAAAGCAKACRPRRWRFAACTSRRTVHRHATRPRSWSFHTTPQARRRKLRKGAFSPVVGALSLPTSGHEPVKLSHGDAESAISPFGTGGPCVLGLL